MILEAGSSLGTLLVARLARRHRCSDRRRPHDGRQVVPIDRQVELFEAIPGARAWRVDGGHDAVIANADRFTPALIEACTHVTAGPTDARDDPPDRLAATAVVAIAAAAAAIWTSVAPTPRLGAISSTPATDHAQINRRGDRSPRRGARNREVARLGAAVGRTYATSSARKLFASAERRVELDDERQLRTAEQVAERLGNMKGALMKIGQMASYLDDGLPEPVRQALAQLQADAPPMSAELAAGVVEGELGAPPDEIFVEWDPEPIAAASIGQVHRAVLLDPDTGAERAVAVKVQYPGVDEAIESDLANTNLLGMVMQQGFRGLDPDEMVDEIKDPPHRGGRLPPGGTQPAAVRRLLPRPPVHPRARRRHVAVDDGVCSPPSWSAGATWSRAADVGPGAARSRRRVPVPLRVPQPVPDAGVQRRPAPRQLPVPR